MNLDYDTIAFVLLLIALLILIIWMRFLHNATALIMEMFEKHTDFMNNYIKSNEVIKSCSENVHRATSDDIKRLEMEIVLMKSNKKPSDETRGQN